MRTTTTPDPGATLSVVVNTMPTNGVLALQFNGSFTYTPAIGFTGTDTFTYRASDGALQSAPVTVTIVVYPANQTPYAQDDEYETQAGVVLRIAAPGVLAKDGDPDANTTITAVAASQPAHGTLSLQPDGSFTNTPAAGFTGADSFVNRSCSRRPICSNSRRLIPRPGPSLNQGASKPKSREAKRSRH